MANALYTATKLAVGKKGILPPDANGYYVMPIGALNAFNSVGQYYTLNGAKELFDQSSTFIRRVNNGRLTGELGHPRRLPGMTDEDYLRRLYDILETNICCHFRKVWLDYDFGKKNPQFKNPNMVAIMAEVKPAGAQGASLKESFDNPDENVCFSIRSLTRDFYERGQCYRVLQQILTFDAVNEPGLASSTMWSSPALESVEETIVTKQTVQSIMQDMPVGVSMEATKQLVQESFIMFDKNLPAPIYTKW